MITNSEVLTFAGALFIMVVTPGPGVIACVSRSLNSGFRKAIFVVMGIITGDLIFVLTALYGLAAIAELMGGFFIIIRYMGALYLVWLGYLTWTSGNTMKSLKYQEESSPVSCYLSGLFITLGNPKAIMFYLSFFPTFLDLSNLTTLDITKTIAIVLSVLTTVLLTYSLAASRLRVVFRNQKSLRNMSRCSGGAMILAGAVMVLKE